MSYLAPASFHFVRGVIGVSKGSDITSLASLEVLALRYVASKIYYHKTCLSKYNIKNPLKPVFAQFLVCCEKLSDSPHGYVYKGRRKMGNVVNLWNEERRKICG